MREYNMAKTEKRQKKPKKVEATDIEEYLKQLPPPPKEHAYELKMEKHLNFLISRTRARIDSSLLG